MRRLLLGAALLAAVPAAFARDALYAEPAAGPRMTIDNRKSRKRLLGTDLYCIRDVVIDGAKVFGGNECRIKHGEKKTIRLAPGRREVVLDTMSEWGSDDVAGVPPVLLTVKVEAGDKDLAVLLRDAEPPEVVALSAPEAAAPAASAATAPAAPVSTGTASDPFASLERLKGLYDKGVVTEDEFKAKKAELLKEIR